MLFRSVLWGVILPLTLLIITLLSRDRLNNPDFRLRYGGIINSYRGDMFYWGIITMLYRLFLMISLVSIDSVVTALATASIITFIYYSLFSRIHPYNSEEFNKLEKYSIISYLVTFFFLSTLLTGC